MITVNGAASEWKRGMTVQDLLDREKFTFRMIAVWIDDSPVEKASFTAREIPDGAAVQVIHNISGG